MLRMQEVQRGGCHVALRVPWHYRPGCDADALSMAIDSNDGRKIARLDEVNDGDSI